MGIDITNSMVYTNCKNSTCTGGVTGKILENHVRENIGWILIKTLNFYIFLDIQ